jgi:hypothetical protein
MEQALKFAEDIYSRKFNLSGIAVEDAADGDRLLTEVSNLIAVLKEAIKQHGESDSVAEVERLRAAIRQMLDANGHLADGDTCTLFALKLSLCESGTPWDGEK